ncbi:SigE family RNA polymerase sigma factor [Streptomyces sp. NPDC093221]|uniref:SigE family RNA polymerase sigma factor n=1 Tax=Streptomyces sp. NPDC093221 TaxID=3366032 RepID=UPI0038004F9D
MTAQPEPAADFDQFYAATAKRMVAVVYTITGDLGEAEDAVQEAYARAWQRWPKLTAEGDPAPWVRTVAVRLAVSTWRKARNRVRAHFRHGPPPDAPALAPDRVALIDALRALGDDQRTAVVMHHLLDLPVEEIARQTGVSSAAVRTRLSRGRRALGALLKDDPADDAEPEPAAYASAAHDTAGRGAHDPAGRDAATATATADDARHTRAARHRTEEVPLHG